MKRGKPLKQHKRLSTDSEKVREFLRKLGRPTRGADSRATRARNAQHTADPKNSASS